MVAVLTVIVAAVATYFLARASVAIVQLRKDAERVREQLLSVGARAEEVAKRQERTREQLQRTTEKMYGTQKDFEVVVKSAAMQRALRVEERGRG